MNDLKRIPITVFTGAGASRADPIALPTMFEFFDQIMDEERNATEARITNKSYFKFILDTIYEDDQDYDLEKIMGALYNMSDFMNNDSWRIFMHPELYSNIINSIKSYDSYSNNINRVRETAEATYAERKNNAKTLIRELEDLIRQKYEPIEYAAIKTVYEPFFDFLINSTHDKNIAPLIPFFTTNYDMSIDWFFRANTLEDRNIQQKWLEKQNIIMVDGFKEQEWFAENFKVINESNTEGKIFVPYHKLHGSLYWEKKNGIVRRNSNVSRDALLNQELMIVYPSDKKILSEDPYHFSHRALDEYLSRTDTLIIIGFSFRDPAIVQAFQYALQYNDKLKVIIVDPSELSSIPEAEIFKRLNSERVEHIQEYFGTEQCIIEINKMIIFK